MSANFRTVDDLNALVAAHVSQIPSDVGLIVGVPRSGMLVASLIALSLDLPLIDLRGYLAGEESYGGRRDEEAQRDTNATRALIVDDSVSSGFEIKRVCKALDESGLRDRSIVCVAYASQAGASLVDLAFERLEPPQVFEWNWLHHPHLPRMCVDIDGVLCRDADPSEDDDGYRYREFLRTAEARNLPSQKIGWLVTSRLEKYRHETEDWLSRHGVEYGELHMMNVSTREERAGQEVRHKSETYRRTGALLFVESSSNQALRIAQETGKPVYCTDTRSSTTQSASTTRQLRSLASRVRNRFRRLLRKPTPR